MAAFVNLLADPSNWQILEARLKYDVLLEDALTRQFVAVFHYHRSLGSTNPSLATIGADFAANVCSVIMPLLNVRCTGAIADMRPLDDALVMPVEVTPSLDAGAVTGDPLSAALAAVVQLFTPARGRSFRGRKHFGGLSESDTDGGDELKASVITSWAAVESACAVTISDGGGNNFNPCVLSPTLSQIFASTPIFTGCDVNSAVLNKILGTMRRRKERVPS
jgi:hypothetical protein